MNKSQYVAGREAMVSKRAALERESRQMYEKIDELDRQYVLDNAKFDLGEHVLFASQRRNNKTNTIEAVLMPGWVSSRDVVTRPDKGSVGDIVYRIKHITADGRESDAILAFSVTHDSIKKMKVS
jgi:hypothetical protein